jgi:trk system potassium uptake protein TrkA
MARKQVLVVGLGRLGSSVARTLFREGHDVLAIDSADERVQEMLGQVTHCVKGDATHEAVLRELGVPNFDGAVVAIGSHIESNIMATVLLKNIGVPRVVSRARNRLHGQILERIGADLVVYPEEEMGSHVARNLFNPDVLEYMQLAPNFGISKVRIPDDLLGQTLQEAGLSGEGRMRDGLAVLAIRRGKEILLLPSGGERIRVDDQLIIASSDELLDRVMAQKNGRRRAD